MPSQKKRPVVLTEADRDELVRVTTTGVHPAVDDQAGAGAARAGYLGG